MNNEYQVEFSKILAYLNKKLCIKLIALDHLLNTIETQ